MNGGPPLLGPAESRPQGEMSRGMEAADLMLTSPAQVRPHMGDTEAVLGLDGLKEEAAGAGQEKVR